MNSHRALKLVWFDGRTSWAPWPNLKGLLQERLGDPLRWLHLGCRPPHIEGTHCLQRTFYTLSSRRASLRHLRLPASSRSLNTWLISLCLNQTRRPLGTGNFHLHSAPYFCKDFFSEQFCCCFLDAKLCPTLCRPMDCSPQFLCPWNIPGKNTGVGCHFLLQGIFKTQGSNLHFPDWRADSLPLSHQGSHSKIEGKVQRFPVYFLYA